MTLSEAIRAGAGRRGHSQSILITVGPDGQLETSVFGAAYEGTFGHLPPVPMRHTLVVLEALKLHYPELEDFALVHRLVKLNHDQTREEIADWLERRG